MIYNGFEYKYVIGISCYGEFVGSVQSGEHDSVESAIDHLSMLTNNRFENNLCAPEKLCIQLVVKRVN